MADTTFVSGTTITSNWLNQVNDFIFDGDTSTLIPGSTLYNRINNTISVKDFGAKGDGVTDDTVALTNFFAAASGKVCIIPSGTYKVTSLLNIGTITGALFIGVRGSTTITGSFGYGIINFTSLANVSFDGISFETTYTNATISSNTAVVYGTSIANVSITYCKFTAPNANTQGFVVFSRTSAGDTTGTLNGLWIENCQFTSIGQTAITLMNRGTASDKYQAARRVYIRNNYAKTLGINNSFGMFISLDGYGSEFDISSNEIEDGYGTLVENTGWWNGTIQGNRFLASTGYTKKWRGVTMDGASYGGIQNVTVSDNKIEGNATIGSYAWNCTNCTFYGNVWTFTEAGFGFDYAFLVVDSNYCTFTNEVYTSDDKYAVQLQTSTGTCSNNQFTNCVASTASSAANVAVVNFDGASTLNNVWSGLMTKGTGGTTWTQTNSATYNSAGYKSVGIWTPNITFATPGDLAVTKTSTGKYTRNGNLITVTFEIDTSAFTWTTASGALQITGLPFGSSSTTQYYGTLGAFRGITKANYTQYSLRTVNGQSYLGVYASGSAQTPTSLQASDMPSGGTVLLYGSITYEAV